MWFDDLPAGSSWASLWTGYILCGHCSGIRRSEGECDACGHPMPSTERQRVTLDGGREIEVAAAFPGAEGRYEDWVYLQMIEREWKRPVPTDQLAHAGSRSGASPRAAVVLLYWSYFETRLERLLRAGLRGAPPRLVEDALSRHSSIGSRFDKLYRVVFDTKYATDLTDLGHGAVWTHLSHVHQQRNAFAHGEPAAIDDALVTSVVEMMKTEHEAWIAVFNRRIARPQVPGDGQTTRT